VLIIGGFLVVIASVAGGYLWHGGNLLLLNQPAEFVIIGGSAAGILLISTPMAVVRELVGQIKHSLSSGPGKEHFAELLVMLYQFFRVAQATGVMALETHVDNPKESSVLSKYPKFLAQHASLAFLTDSARVIIVGGLQPHDFDQLMSEDIEVRHRERLHPSVTLNKIADALPGLGIVAAVLGVVITMQAIDGPPSEIGHKVGAALVGTFLGILLSYGFVQPLAASLEHRVHEEMITDHVIKAGLLATYKGLAPAIAIEFARRIIPEEVRPSFEETEQMCRSARTEAPAAAAA
jgi:chemotaxis protein MotA